MNCLIVDDDPVMAHILETMIAEFDFLNLVSICSNVKDAINVLEKEKVDLIFLDIEMPNINGIEFLSFFPLNDVQVIIVSSHKKYAVETYNFEVTDYLLKPIDKGRFYKAVLKVKGRHKETENPKSIFVKINSVYHSFLFADINYLESIGDYINLHTSNNKYTIYSSLKKISSLLPEDEFFRIHNSYIVRVDKILKFEDNMVYIAKACLPISRTQKNKLLKVLNVL